MKNYFTKTNRNFREICVIVGDFSGGQLRLKGFYYNERKNVPLDLKCVTIPEYIAEYCAYGCPYYVVEKIVPKQHSEEWTTSKK